MAEILSLIAGWITGFLMSFGLWGVFLALALEAACIPIASEVFLLFGGFLVAQGTFGLLETALAGTAGFVAGSLFPYYVGRRHGRAILGQGGRFFFAREGELDKVEGWFERYGVRAVLLGRWIPVVRDFISIPAGHAGVPLARFAVYTAIGSFPWIIGVTWAGALLEAEWRSLLDVLAKANRVVWAMFGITVTTLILRRYMVKRRAASQ